MLFAPKRSVAEATFSLSTDMTSPSSVTLYGILSPSSRLMISDASLVDSQVIRTSYCGLVSIVARIASATTTPAATLMIIVFCFVVNLFHHSKIFCGISLNLSSITYSVS